MSLITSKYNYKELKRKHIDGRRLYACPDGNSVASVTTILDATKDKTHLIYTSVTIYHYHLYYLNNIQCPPQHLLRLLYTGPCSYLY